MKPNERDMHLLKHIAGYCSEIGNSMERFGPEYETFLADPDYKNSCALCILQIGELAGRLSEGFKQEYDKVPWRQIKALRNIVAHRYGVIESATLWEVMIDDVPVLRSYCEAILSAEAGGVGEKNN